MAITTSRVAPFPPIFEVEIIDAEGFGWLYPYLQLHEAIKICAFFEVVAEPGKDPRIAIMSEHLMLGPMDD